LEHLRNSGIQPWDVRAAGRAFRWFAARHYFAVLFYELFRRRWRSPLRAVSQELKEIATMASTVWKGYLAFGLISVPIRLFAAARSERISFNQIHEPCGSRIKQQTYCPVCERTVERSELKKGYEVAKGRFVIVEDEEIKKIAPPSSETMEILEFVKVGDIDPIYFDASYFMAPEDAGKKAYALLLKTMEKSGFGAIAKVTMHQREYTVVIRPHGHGLTLHTMFYPEEVREVPEYGRDTDVEVKPQEAELAEKLVKGLATTFEPSKYHDEYQSQLAKLIEAKKEGQEVQAGPARKLAPVIDLMQALQQSLGQVQKKPAARETHEAAEAKPAKRPRARTAR
jgi:DNA end-binding protein Ku